MVEDRLGNDFAKSRQLHSLGETVISPLFPAEVIA